MNRSIRSLACAGALLSLLTFTAPVHAAGWTYSAPDGGIFQAAWEWIMGAWTPGSEAQGQRAGKGGPGINPDGLKSDHGPGIDPDGKPNSTTTSTCVVGCDKSAAGNG
jgi:hypothetical protein